jgi:hypothetical protein
MLGATLVARPDIALCEDRGINSDYEKTDFHFCTAGSRYDSKLLCVGAARHHDYDYHYSGASNDTASGDESTCNDARWYVGELAFSLSRKVWSLVKRLAILGDLLKANDGGKL